MVPRLFWLTWLFASVSFFRTHAATGAGASFPFSPFGWGLVDKAKDMLDGLYADMTEEAQFRRSTIEQYRDEISGRVQATIDRFRTDQLRRQTKAERDLEKYKQKLNKLYLDNLLALGKQRQAVQDLGKRKAVRRPAKMDDSLEQFRKLYEETGPLVDPYTVAKNYWERTRDWLTSLAPGTVPVVSFPSDYVQIERRIERQIDTLTRHVHRGVQGAVETASEGVEALERTFRNAADDLRRMPEDVVSSARSVAASTQASIRNTIDKRDVRRETRDLEAKLQALSREGAQWMDSKRQQVETTIRTLQETLQQRNTEFEEMISKRRVSMQYASMNDATLSQILKLIDPADKGWKLIKSEGGYEVHRKFLGFGPASQYACVMCHGVINSAPKVPGHRCRGHARVAEHLFSPAVLFSSPARLPGGAGLVRGQLPGGRVQLVLQGNQGRRVHWRRHQGTPELSSQGYPPHRSPRTCSASRPCSLCVWW